MPRRHAQTDTSKKRMIEALKKSLGIVTVAAKTCGIERKTHYRWLESDPKYKAEVEELKNIALDFVEGQLFTQIKNNEVASTIFYLKTQGKTRGYIERNTLDLNMNEELPIFPDKVKPKPKNEE